MDELCEKTVKAHGAQIQKTNDTKEVCSMEKLKAKIVNIWKKRNDNVKPVVAWSVFGGVLVVAIALALIFWL